MNEETGREIELLTDLLEYLPGYTDQRGHMGLVREKEAAELHLAVLQRLSKLVKKLEG